MDGKKVAGIIAHDEVNDKYIQANAPVVLMVSGGFICNREMVEKYSPFSFDNFYNLGTDGRDGDGINMGIAADQAVEYIAKL